MSGVGKFRSASLIRQVDKPENKFGEIEELVV